MKNTNTILLVRVPADDSVDGRKLRDYILESLPMGVLVLTDDATCEVMELPALGGVEVEPSGPLESSMEGLGIREMSSSFETEEDEAEPPPVVVATGRNKEEKLAILERLREYRRTHGLGCWNEVAEKAGGDVTPDLIRAIHLGEESTPIADWRRIDRAVQLLTAKADTPC